VDYLVIAFVGAVFMTILIVCSKWFFSLAQSSVNLLDTFLAPGSEDDKLPLIEKRTKRLTRDLLLVVALLIVAFAIAAFIPKLYTRFVVTGRPFAPNEVWNIVALSVGATLPLFVPRGTKNKSAYTPLAQLLHHLALDNPNVGLRLQRRDVKAAEKLGIEQKNEFVIITGLARSGTTSLLNTLAPLGPFASLNYANMPFVLAPRTWARVYRPKDAAVKERSHGDGVMVGLNTNEAFEEVFFKAITEDSYIGADCVQEHELTVEQYERYLDYQRVVRRSNDDIYIAKNNNFLLRYRSVREHNPDFTAIILFREPLHHASSLLEKHLQYVEMQEHDPFVLEYMNWLAHHEFGWGRKGFCFDETHEWAQKAELWPKEHINHWLALWIAVYAYGVEIDDTNTHFVSYGEFCSEPTEVVNRILRSTASGREAQNIPSHRNERTVEHDADADLLAEAERVYARLLRKANNERE